MAHTSMSLVENFKSLTPQVSELLAISGSPGLSIGVLYEGQVIYTTHLGKQDLNSELSPNDDTVYRIASLGKPLAVGAIALLIERGHFTWDTPIQEILPEFGQRQDEIGQRATIIDFLSNRTGLAQAAFYWAQQNGEFFLPKTEILRATCAVQAVKPLGKAFIYSNWSYGIITNVVERVSGQDFESFLQQNITGPLKMYRTTFDEPLGENIASAHAVLNDGTPCKIPYPGCSNLTGFAAGSGAKGSVHDLLLMYQCMLASYNDQKRTGMTRTPGSPFVQLKTVFQPHIQVYGGKIEDRAYCLGLYRTKLPGNVGVASFNDRALDSSHKHISGIHHPGLEIFHHTGAFPGGLSSMFMIPSSESAIVVATNSMPLFDPTDFVGQLFLSILLGDEVPSNFPRLSKLLLERSLTAYSSLSAQLENEKTDIPPRHPLKAYEGDYVSLLGNLVLSIKAQPESLLMVLQHKKSTRYQLLPYDGDVFYWPADRENELCKRGMFPMIRPGWHKVEFNTSEHEVFSLTWSLDPLTFPYVFTRKPNVARGECLKL